MRKKRWPSHRSRFDHELRQRRIEEPFQSNGILISMARYDAWKCPFCPHGRSRHRFGRICQPVFKQSYGCDECDQELMTLYANYKPLEPIAITVSQADRNWIKEVDAAYLERQYAAMHIRRG